MWLQHHSWLQIYTSIHIYIACIYTLKIYTTQAMVIQISLIYFIEDVLTIAPFVSGSCGYMKWSRDHHQNKIMYISLVWRMDAFCRNPNRTVPVAEDNPHRADVPLCSRTNGWSWPPHPFQLLAWLLYIYFAITTFGVFVPLLPAHWIPAGYIVSLHSNLIWFKMDAGGHNFR